MNMSNYTSLLSQRLKTYFEVKTNKYNVDLFASTSLILGRTMVSQKDIIDKFESNEYILVKFFDEFSSENVNTFIDYIKTTPELLVKPNKNHKSSYINAIMVCNDITATSSINKIKKFKYEKFYRFYFQGFCEIRLFAVDIENNKVFSNKAGKSFKKVYQPIP